MNLIPIINSVKFILPLQGIFLVIEKELAGVAKHSILDIEAPCRSWIHDPASSWDPIPGMCFAAGLKQP